MFAAYWIQMTETVQFNFLPKATTFKVRFSNCADICLATMQMDLHYKGELETCVCIKLITWNIWEQSQQFVFSFYTLEIIIRNAPVRLFCETVKRPLEILHYVCEGVCFTSWFVYADITSKDFWNRICLILQTLLFLWNEFCRENLTLWILCFFHGCN